jgi:hypothetical protein
MASVAQLPNVHRQKALTTACKVKMPYRKAGNAIACRRITVRYHGTIRSSVHEP